MLPLYMADTKKLGISVSGAAWQKARIQRRAKN